METKFLLETVISVLGYYFLGFVWLRIDWALYDKSATWKKYAKSGDYYSGNDDRKLTIYAWPIAFIVSIGNLFIGLFKDSIVRFYKTRRVCSKKRQ